MPFTRLAGFILLLGFACGWVRFAESKTIKETTTDICLRAEPSWTAIEANIWTQLCQSGTGRGASVPEAIRDRGFQKQPVRAEFLHTILVNSPYNMHMKKWTIWDIQVRGQLKIESAKLPGELRFADIDAPQGIWMESLEIDGSLLFLNVCAKSILITDSRIQGNLEIEGEQQENRCPAYALILMDNRVFGNLHMSELNLEFAILARSRIGTEFRLDNVSTPSLSLNDANVDGPVRLYNLDLKKLPAPKNDKVSNRARGGLKLDGLRATSNVTFGSVTSEGPVSIADANIDGSLLFDDVSFLSSVNISNAHIGKALVMGSVASPDVLRIDPHYLHDSASSSANTKGDRGILWGKESSLALANTSVGAVETLYDLNSWPLRMDLTNFKFGAFFGREVERENVDVGEWFKLWLARANGMWGMFNPEPYETVAHYLSSVGQPDAAVTVGVAEHDFERDKACEAHWYGGGRCIFSWMSKLIIRYGYAPWTSIYGAIFFVVVGALVFRTTKEAKGMTRDAMGRYPIGLAYSFDIFLPLIRLRERHYTIDLAGPARYYFYIHKLAGWVIGSFLVAALAGLTK